MPVLTQEEFDVQKEKILSEQPQSANIKSNTSNTEDTSISSIDSKNRPIRIKSNGKDKTVTTLIVVFVILFIIGVIVSVSEGDI